MTDLRQAAQQALEALCRCTPEQRTASDALRAALAQEQQEQEQAMHDLLTTGTGVLLGGERIDPASMYKQEEQEPVAWMFQHEETRRMNYVSNDGCNSPGRFLVMNPRYALVCALYTTPPRREWQSLSEEEIDWLLEAERMKWAKNSPPTYEFAPAFARAIEAKLKEKNND